jgi:hypothetical protein
MKLTTHIHLVLRIKTSGAKLSLLLYAFMTCTGTAYSSKCQFSFEFLHFVVIESSDGLEEPTSSLFRLNEFGSHGKKHKRKGHSWKS